MLQCTAAVQYLQMRGVRIRGINTPEQCAAALLDDGVREAQADHRQESKVPYMMRKKNVNRQVSPADPAPVGSTVPENWQGGDVMPRLEHITYRYLPGHPLKPRHWTT